jgi:hypothetical protein
MTKVAILSRYKETDTTWYNILKNEYDNVIIFNKFNGKNLLPNVGREGHTYLYYIVNNYDNLPDEMLFSQYDPTDHFHRKNIHEYRDINHMNFFLKSSILDFICINAKDYDVFVRKRPVDWIKYYNLLYNNNIDFNHVVSIGACLNGVFRVTKQSVLRHSKDFYDRALSMLSKDRHPTEGYFFERAWKYIFTNYGNCPEKYSYLLDSVWLFGNDIIQSVHKTRRDEAYGHLKLYSDGLIGGKNFSSLYGNSNEHYWTVYEDKFYILSAESAITSCFVLPENIDNVSQILGDYYSQDGILNNFFFLRKPMWSYYFK